MNNPHLAPLKFDDHFFRSHLCLFFSTEDFILLNTFGYYFTEYQFCSYDRKWIYFRLYKQCNTYQIVCSNCTVPWFILTYPSYACSQKLEMSTPDVFTVVFTFTTSQWSFMMCGSTFKVCQQIRKKRSM